MISSDPKINKQLPTIDSIESQPEVPAGHCSKHPTRSTQAGERLFGWAHLALAQDQGHSQIDCVCVCFSSAVNTAPPLVRWHAHVAGMF